MIVRHVEPQDRAGWEWYVEVRSPGDFGLSLMYPTTLNEIDEVRDAERQYPGAQSIVDRLVTLPTHEYVSPNDKQVICALVAPHLMRHRVGDVLATRT